MFEQIGAILWNITLGSFPYNIGPWTITILSSVLILNKAFGEDNKTITRMNQFLMPK